MADTTNKRIAKNTVMLYIRMLFTMAVGLYTSRVVLQTLGVSDYGVYNIVGGVVAMLGFLNASMSGATSRFITYAIGQGNEERLQKTFSSAVIIHVGIAFVVFIIAETAGLWFLLHKLVIPEGRMDAAVWVYQLSMFSALLGVVQVPYNATIIAHEKMDVFAYIEIVNVSLKLLIVYLLQLWNYDKLVLYAILVCCVSVVVACVYRAYCFFHFQETHFKFVVDKATVMPMLSFSGWDMYGNLSYSVSTQGTNFVLNAFGGTIINAAAGIATTVQGVLKSFSSNVIIAFRPPIIKSYANGDFTKMNKLMSEAFILSSLLICLIINPVISEMQYLLHLWLGMVPAWACTFSQLSVGAIFWSNASLIIIIGLHACGQVRLMGLLCGTISIMSVGVAYLLLYAGLNFNYVFGLALCLGVLYVFIDLFLLKKYISEFEARTFILRSFLPSTVIFLLSLILTFCISALMQEGIGRLAITCLANIVIIFLLSLICFRHLVIRTLILIKDKLM